MQNFKKKANLAAANWVRKIGRAAMEKWPPDCYGISFQPQHPARPEHEKMQTQTGKKARL